MEFTCRFDRPQRRVERCLTASVEPPKSERTFVGPVVPTTIHLTRSKRKHVLEKVGFVLACLILPVVWGVIVNWLFEFWRDRNEEKRDIESIFPDYQI